MDPSLPSQQPRGTRRRGTQELISKTTTEDQTLDKIAKEAEVRLAAKRAARAEARSIRMKEIEREQKVRRDNDGDLPKEEVLLQEKRSSSQSNTPRERTSLSRLSSVTRLSVDESTGESQVRELKALIRAEEAKYKKAMVNNAQLDNERQALQYQVEMLRDAVEELQENLVEKEEDLQHQCRDYSKLSREHENMCAELSKSNHIITERERVLDEHGVNVDGSVKEGCSPPDSSPGLCSSCVDPCSGDMNDINDQSDRSSLLAEISFLRSEIFQLKMGDPS